MHHKGFVERLFVIIAFNMNQRSLRQRRQHLVGGLGFKNHLTWHPFTAHPAFPLIDRMKMGIRHPGRIKMNRGHIQRLLDPVGVIQQAVIGGVGDHRMHRPLRLYRLGDLALDTLPGKFTLRYTTQDTQRVARWLEPYGHDIAHHQQMRQRLMTVAVNQ